MSVFDEVIDDEKVWSLVALASATLAAIATRNLLQSGWEAVRQEEPPQNPAARSTSWPDALGWTIATGVAVGLARMLAQRGAAAGWKKVRGDYPEGLD